MAADNVVHLLHSLQRETNCERALKTSCKIARTIILESSMEFRPVWKRRSNKHVCIGLDRRMYFDNHQVAYYNDGINDQPRLLYDFGAIGKHMKIWAVLLYHAHVRRRSPTCEEREVCLLVLSADGYLRVFNANTGTVLRTVFLSTTDNYRYLQWADYLHTVQVKSVQFSRSSSRQGGVAHQDSSSRLLIIALFRVHPLHLVACFSVDRKIFGGDIQDASVNQDVLVVAHSRGYYRMYSLPWIMTHHSSVVQATLGEWVELDHRRAGVVGETGFGVPLTLDITERPPLLFEAQSGSELGVSFGGSPLLYLHNPSPADNSVFLLHTLHSRELVAKFSTDTVAFHQDVAEFHHDDYLKILHISGSSLSCHQLMEQRVVKLFTTDFRLLSKRIERPLRTSSGRTIRRRVCAEDMEDLYVSAVQDVDYENELDLLYAVVTLPSRGEGSDDGTEAWLCFIDNTTGHVIKKVFLPTWKTDASNSVYYELDCILHLVQDSGISTCYYYRLTRL